MSNGETRWYPSVSNNVDPSVASSLKIAHDNLFDLRDMVNTLAQSVAQLPSMAEISKALSALGTNPLPLYNLPGSTPTDLVIPGVVQGFSMSASGNGKFVADWSDPLTGILTLDGAAVQYADDAAFTTNVVTLKYGRTNHVEVYMQQANKYFRVTVHNESNQPSDPGTLGLLGSTGWGPWSSGILAHSGQSAGMVFGPGSSVAGDVAYFSDTTGALLANMSQSIFCVDRTHTRVGIGNPTPSYTLDVNGQSRFVGVVNLPEGVISMVSVNNNSLPYIDMQRNQIGGSYNTDWQIYLPTSSMQLRIWNNSSGDVLVLDPSGKVGIGKSPGYTLDAGAGGIHGGYFDADYGYGHWQIIADGSSAGLAFYNYATGHYSMVIKGATDRVGIGRLDPGYTVDVTGDCRISGNFGCNGRNPNAPLASGGLPTYSDGAHGCSSAADFAAIYALLVTVRTCLIDFGLMT
jgi:hypothetical protein